MTALMTIVSPAVASFFLCICFDDDDMTVLFLLLFFYYISQVRKNIISTYLPDVVSVLCCNATCSFFIIHTIHFDGWLCLVYWHDFFAENWKKMNAWCATYKQFRVPFLTLTLYFFATFLQSKSVSTTYKICTGTATTLFLLLGMAKKKKILGERDRE